MKNVSGVIIGRAAVVGRAVLCPPPVSVEPQLSSSPSTSSRTGLARRAQSSASQSGRALVDVVLLVALVALIGLALGMKQSPRERNVEFIPEMLDPVPYETYSENEFLPDGRTLQAPVKGTVLYGAMPLHYGPGEVDAERAGREIVSPVAPDDAKAVQRGQAVYASFCLICHGPEGKGDGTVARRGFPTPAPLDVEKAMALPDGRIFHIITHGQVNMPPYASMIEESDRWKVIAYVRELQRRAVEKAQKEAEALQGGAPKQEALAAAAEPAAGAVTMEGVGND